MLSCAAELSKAGKHYNRSMVAVHVLVENSFAELLNRLPVPPFQHMHPVALIVAAC